MADPRNLDPNRPNPADPLDPRSPYSDPAADPRIANQTVVSPSGGRGGLIAAGVIAVLLVIALIAFSSGPSTDPGTTAVIPDATEESAPAGDTAAPEAAAPEEPAAPAPEATTPLEEEPAGEAPAAPAPAEDAPAANQ